jgi:Protein of unknown function (DUF5132)
MRFSPLSFLIGLGAAWALPVVARSFRSLAVEATVTGLALMEEARRVIAEQREQLEDIAAEARARRDERVAAEDAELDTLADAESGDADTEDAADSDNGDAPVGGRRRRRARRAPTGSR